MEHNLNTVEGYNNYFRELETEVQSNPEIDTEIDLAKFIKVLKTDEIFKKMKIYVATVPSEAQELFPRIRLGYEESYSYSNNFKDRVNSSIYLEIWCKSITQLSTYFNHIDKVLQKEGILILESAITYDEQNKDTVYAVKNYRFDNNN